MSFESEILSYRIPIKAYAIKLLGSHYGVAEDIVQDTMVKALKNKKQYTEGTNLKAWVMTILRNEIYNHFRKAKYGYVVSATRDDASTIDVPIPADQEILIQWKEFEKVFQTLQPDHRRSLELIFIEGYTYEQAAKIEKVPEGTIKSRVSRARTILRKEFELPDQDGISMGVISNEGNRRSQDY